MELERIVRIERASKKIFQEDKEMYKRAISDDAAGILTEERKRELTAHKDVILHHLKDELRYMQCLDTQATRTQRFKNSDFFLTLAHDIRTTEDCITSLGEGDFQENLRACLRLVELKITVSEREIDEAQRLL